jgi:hypothetical protein
VLLDVFWIGWGEKHTTFAMAARIYTGCLQYIVPFMCELPFFSVIGGQVLPHCSFIYLWFSKNGSGNTAAFSVGYTSTVGYTILFSSIRYGVIDEVASSHTVIGYAICLNKGF